MKQWLPAANSASRFAPTKDSAGVRCRKASNDRHRANQALRDRALIRARLNCRGKQRSLPPTLGIRSAGSSYGSETCRRYQGIIATLTTRSEPSKIFASSGMATLSLKFCTRSMPSGTLLTTSAPCSQR